MTLAVQNEPAKGLPASPAVPRDAAGVERATLRFMGKRGPFRPSVRLLDVGGARMVAKDYRDCTPLYRWTVGRWNLAREEAALRALDGVEGVPRLLGRTDGWILLMSWMRGRDLGKVRRFRQSPEFFDKLMRVVEEMHARGVVHLDLRQRRNILLCLKPDKVARPAILDFGSALCVRKGGLLHGWLARIDRSGVLKYKRRAQPGTLTRDEARSLRRIERRRKLWPF